MLILSAIAMIAPLAAVWGALYLAVGAPRAAAIPWLYVVIAAAGIGLFAVHRSLRWLALTQLVPYILLPFVLMWMLGGFISGSAVALWALFAPLAALIVSGPRAAAPWLVVFVALVVASAFVELNTVDELSSNAVEAFFVLNLGGVTAVAFGFVGSCSAAGTHRPTRCAGSSDATFRPASPRAARGTEAGARREVAEVTVLFADLRGFTAASERIAPDEAVQLLNRYFALALPIIEAEGGTPIQLAGDQVMAIFNAPERHADHALRAARAALEIQRQVDAAVGTDALPRFGIGINTGPALVGNIGSESFFNFTAVGDTTNLAARLTAEAAAGKVVLGPASANAVRAVARLTARGGLRVKGRREPVEAFVLEELRTHSDTSVLEDMTTEVVRQEPSQPVGDDDQLVGAGLGAPDLAGPAEQLADRRAGASAARTRRTARSPGRSGRSRWRRSRSARRCRGRRRRPRRPADRRRAAATRATRRSPGRGPPTWPAFHSLTQSRPARVRPDAPRALARGRRLDDGRAPGRAVDPRDVAAGERGVPDVAVRRGGDAVRPAAARRVADRHLAASRDRAGRRSRSGR